MTTTSTPSALRIPRWITVVQGVLVLIMLSQVYLFFVDHEAVRASGITIETVADHNLAYEFGARTLTMALVSIAVMVWQRVEPFLALFLMNVLREGQETIIDPLYPLANAPVSPVWDIVTHLVIVGIEVWAFIRLYQIMQRQRTAGLPAAAR